MVETHAPHNIIENLPWDSKLFDYPVSRFFTDNLDIEFIKQEIDSQKEIGMKLMYCFVNPGDVKIIDYFKANSVLLADRKITYEKDISSSDMYDVDPSIIDIIYQPLDKEILSLALQSGQFSRFRVDEHFANSEFEKMYKIWIENSLSGKIAKSVYVFEISGTKAGLITLGIKDDSGDIGLLSVDEKFRGQKIGTKLIHAACKRTIDLGLSKIK